MRTYAQALLLLCLLCLAPILSACDGASVLTYFGLETAKSVQSSDAQAHNTIDTIEKSVRYADQLLPVATELAAPLKAVAAVRYTATLMPREEVPVLFRVGGYISDIFTVHAVPATAEQEQNPRIIDAERGAAVKKGDVLVQLRTTDYQGRVAAARGVLNEALASRRQAILDLERYRTLLASKAIALAEYDQIVERVDAVKAKEEAARGNLAQAMEMLKDTTLFSPMDGIITHKSVQRGMLAVAGTAAYTVADFSRMKALFGVPDWLVSQIQVGDVLPVDVSVLGHVAQGQIVSVSPSADAQSRVFDVEIELDNADGAMKDGMTASVLWRESGLMVDEQSLQESVKKDIPAVSMSAIMRPHGKIDGYAVFVVEKQDDSTQALRVRERQVVIGRVEGDKVELLTGVQVGEQVVVLGATRLFDGATVRILPKGEDGHVIP